MELSQTPSLTTLLVFENTINKELIRTLHVYRLDNEEEHEVEREFVFRKDAPYVEMAATPLLRLQGFRPQDLFEGRVLGTLDSLIPQNGIFFLFLFQDYYAVTIDMCMQTEEARIDQKKHKPLLRNASTSSIIVDSYYCDVSLHAVDMSQQRISQEKSLMECNVVNISLPIASFSMFDTLISLSWPLPSLALILNNFNATSSSLLSNLTNAFSRKCRLPHDWQIVQFGSRNPKLKSIPSLANDLQKISQRDCSTEERGSSGESSKETYTEVGHNHCQSKRSLPVLDQDLNCLPNSVATSEILKSQQIEQSATGDAAKKRKRADSKDIARIALEDLAKYFDLPIVEASRNLNIGLTVLKRKCREFGIPRWPHRKIKSLDGLIRDLQEEADKRQEEDEAAAFAVEKRRMMLESERESIERDPFIELKSETKRFRQDIFKRRHKARALKS
ncbi:Plant regulator RWP-RK [Corchorus olitorius]|uniref:Plant regulator RWP-RK n=1 Tax=Corchorus olitorius TaxID=93759 RepID=A0A1R3JX51_9ROSI|nr:Plant regulator RWP-RK [Corchorus olitorius]